MSEFYGELKSQIDELEMHQLVITDAVTMRGYHQDLTVSNLLSGLSPSLCSQVRGQILGGDSILTLTALSLELCVCRLWMVCHLH